MPTYPQTGINFGNFLTHTSDETLGLGIIHSMSLAGGFQEVPTIAERNAIPVQANDPNGVYNGFTAAGDGGWTSGRRKVGMLVYVVENQKLYSLIPVGYYNNGGTLGETEWLALSDAEKAVRIFPTGTFTEETANPGNGFIAVNKDAASEGIAADDNSCWVELTLGGGADGLTYDPQTGTLSLYEGSTLIDSTPINSGNLFKFYAPTSTYYKVDGDGDYVGGAAANQNPTIYVTKGETYTFRREEVGHPLEIRDSNGDPVTAGIRAGVNPVNGAGAVLVWHTS